MPVNASRFWYGASWPLLAWLLLPFSFLFGVITACRRWLYRSGVIKTQRFSVPVIVAGNITVGGTGKTPFVIWLAAELQSRGYRPGIVSRGVGGKKQAFPHLVTARDSTREVGDEAVLLRNSGCPVMLCVNRAAAVKALLEQTDCNIIISDDGLQHYRLGRDLEVAIVDGVRRFGNGLLLPAGPLREACSRLNRVDFIVVNGGNDGDDYSMLLEPDVLAAVGNPARQLDLASFSGKTVHAVAAIGHPERFFSLLQHAGLRVIPHAFPDHYQFRASDLEFPDSHPILMTEKDAVKCGAFAADRCWYLRVKVKINNNLADKIISRISALETSHDYEKDFGPGCKKHSCGIPDSVQRDSGGAAGR